MSELQARQRETCNARANCRTSMITRRAVSLERMKTQMDGAVSERRIGASARSTRIVPSSREVGNCSGDRAWPGGVAWPPGARR